MDFLDCEDDLPGPSERLEAILDPRRHVQAPGSPYSELNLLYRQILSTCRNWEAVRRILSLLVTPHRPLVTPHPFPQCGLYDQQGRTRSVVTWRSPMLLEHFLKLRTGDVRNLLSRLHSVLGVPKNEGSDITVLHTSFVEYLLDPSRSGEYHTEELPESTYFDYVASFLLRQVSLSTSHFPHSSSAESWSSWDDHVTTASQLRRYAFRNSLVFCQQVKSPSKELLAALDQFDPYPSMTMVINLEYMTGDLGLAIRHYFDFWRSAVSWAKSLERKPKVFIRSLESFFNGFTIVAHPEARNFWAGPAAFCESSLAPTSDSSWSEVLHCVSLLGRLFASRDYVGRLGRVYVVPTSTQSPGEGWLRTEVKSRRGKQFNTRAIALFDGSKTREAQSKLLQDIASWTRESVPTLDLVKRTTLHSLTKFVAKRRQDLGLPPYAYNGSDDDSSGMDSPAGSVKGMEVDNAIIAPVPLLAASTIKTSGSVESFYSSGNFRDNRSPIMTHSSGSSPLSDQVSFNRIDSPTPWDSDQGSNASSRGSRSSMASSHRNRSFILTDPIPATGSSRGAWSPVFRQDSD
ncbi:hypothetical protein VNI00_007719 [Paramarasmius palmivorus]|uniref:Meiotically up-regulated protein Msb1/Mug8 domain-containing protein n=1 Tax=Paramarasmius palmivorus TaxID=297713 RepID=A0AAW0D4P7_9AGAR